MTTDPSGVQQAQQPERPGVTKAAAVLVLCGAVPWLLLYAYALPPFESSTLLVATLVYVFGALFVVTAVRGARVGVPLIVLVFDGLLMVPIVASVSTIGDAAVESLVAFAAAIGALVATIAGLVLLFTRASKAYQLGMDEHRQQVIEWRRAERSGEQQ